MGPRRWQAAVLVGAIVASYGNSLEGPFISDDIISIVQSVHIRELWDLNVLFPEKDTSFAGRPLVNISFAINYALGGLDVRGYHIGNILVHAWCALLVCAVVTRSLRLPALAGRFGALAPHLGFATALIFAVHPINGDVVNYLVQRTESMMALFYLLTLYACLRALDSWRRRVWEGVAVLSCALGMACKESMATAPVMILLFDRVYVFESWASALRARWRVYPGLAATWLVVAALQTTGPRGEGVGFSSEVTPWTYLLNQVRMIAQYLELAVWPRELVADYGWVLPLTLADVWPYALAIVPLLALTAVLLFTKPRIGFLGAWFFITLAPTTSIVPIAKEVGRECRMYLPMVSLILLAVVGCAMLWSVAERQKLVSSARAALAGSALLVVLSTSLAAATVARNREYSSAVGLYRTVVDRWPTSRTKHILANELLRNGRGDEAIPFLRDAAPTVPWARYDLAVELFNRGQLDEAVAHFEAVVDIWTSPPPKHPHWQQPLRVHAVGARVSMGKAFTQQQRWADAIEQFRLALAIDPGYTEASGLLGQALVNQGSLDEALAIYREYVQRRPNDAAALTNLGVALVGKQQVDEAIPIFRRAADLDPAIGARSLANALFDTGDMAQALVHAERAVAARPDDPGALDVLGRALAVHGRFSEAVARFERALAIDPANADAREHLARVRARAP